MNDVTMTRREVLVLLASSGLAVSGGSVMLVGCKSEKRLDCTDTSALTETERQTRKDLEYVDKGNTAVCEDCANFEPKGENQCGGCTLIKGPINPKGYCKEWTAKEG